MCLSTRHGLTAEPMPNVGGVLDLAEIKRWLVAHRDDIERAFVESVHAMPKQGVSSSFKFGRVFGEIQGLLVGLDIPFELVTPQKWQRELHAGIEGSLDAKDRSRMAFSRLFPSYDLKATPRCRTQHMGMLDAALIATYGHRKMVNS